MGRILDKWLGGAGLVVLILLFCLGFMTDSSWAKGGKVPLNGSFAWEQLRRLAAESADKVRAAGYEASILDMSGSEPNFFSISVQQARQHLDRFKTFVGMQNRAGEDLGQIAQGVDGAKWFRRYASRAGNDNGLKLLERIQQYCETRLGVAEDRFWSSLLHAKAGRDGGLSWMVEQLAILHLNKALHQEALNYRGLQAIPFPGVRSAMSQVWRTLEKNGLMRPSASLALMGPMNPAQAAALDLGHHKIIHLTPQPNQAGRHMDETDFWPLDLDEIKALVMVNPSSPGADAIDAESLAKMARYMREKKPDLVVVTLWQGADLRYQFSSFMAQAPKNVIGIYSFGDYAGSAAGGAAYLAMHSDFALNNKFARLPKSQRRANAKRYGLSLAEEAGFPIHERMRLDLERQAGFQGGIDYKINLLLATAMALMDGAEGPYYKQLKAMWFQRRYALEEGLGIKKQNLLGIPPRPDMLNLALAAEHILPPEYLPEFFKTTPWEFARKLAREHWTVLLPAGPGQALPWHFWLDLRGLSPEDCLRAGNDIARVMRDMLAEWEKTQPHWIIRDLDKWDRTLFKLINLGLNHPNLDPVMPWISNLIPLVPVILAALWLVLAYRIKGVYMVLGLALLFILTDSVTTQVLRPWLERPRPYAALEGIRYCFGAEWHVSTAESIVKAAAAFGLPSAHAANSMGPALFVMRFSPQAGAVLVSLTLLVSYSRVYLGLHYPGDVLAGMLWGGFCGWAWAWLVARVLKAFGQWPPQRLK